MSLLYIDPGTGSMLLSLFIGLATAAVFGLRALFIKLQFFFSGGKRDKTALLDAIPYVIYSDHKRYWNVFKPICDEFEKRKIPVTFYTQSSDDPALAENYEFVKTEFIGEGNKGFAKLNYLNANIVLSTTPGLDVYQWKRSKKVKWYVHVSHAIGSLAGYRMFGLDYYDAVLLDYSSQAEDVRKLEELRPSIAKKELITVGSVVLDNLKIKLDSSGSATEEKEQKVVLVAPTWGESGILTKYGEKFLASLEKTSYKVIVRPHPQTVVSEKHILEPLQKKFSNFEWNFDNDNFDVLKKADILISDYSGVIFDFSLVFDKPIIYADFAFDTLPYDADWLDYEYWIFRILPQMAIKLKEEDFSNMQNVIQNALESSELKNGRDKMRSECWEHVGESAKRIVDYLVGKQEKLNDNLSLTDSTK